MKTEKFGFEQYLKSVGFIDDYIFKLETVDGFDYRIKLVGDNLI